MGRQRIAYCPHCYKSDLSIFKPKREVNGEIKGGDMISTHEGGKNTFYCKNCDKLVRIEWRVIFV